MTHCFADSLAMSHAASDWQGWDQLYRDFFPDFVAMVDHRDNGYWQLQGIDRSLVLSSSKQVLIDEKVRGRNKLTGRVYADIALEFVSNNSTGAKGWVCKPLMADYIAYAILPLGRCYLLPVVQLQSAWMKLGSEWRYRYGEREAINRGYETIFTPVPVPALFAAIGACLRSTFEPFEFTETADNR